MERFIFKSAERYLPFFSSFETSCKIFVWIAECRKEWEKLKQYMQNSPLLSSTKVSEVVYIYLAICNLAIASVLLREIDNKQLSIYYVSKVLNVHESRYPNIEKLTYSLVVAAQKHRIYFEAHTIVV